ncbi:hypothetical protein MRX96_028890 [Rhipicephalus microplus]
MVASVLPSKASEVRDLAAVPPIENAFQVLKETLIRHVTPSESERLQQQLHLVNRASADLANCCYICNE